MTFLFFFSALGAFNGFLLSLYFAINAKKKVFTNFYLSLLLLVLSVRIAKSVFFFYNPDLSNFFIQIGLSACILIGPFLFLYLKSYTSTVKQNWAAHIFPYLIVMGVLGYFYPYDEHIPVWTSWILKGIYLQWFVYTVISLKYLQSIFKKIKEKENLKRLDVWLLSIYFGVAFTWLAYTTAAYTSYIVGALSFTFVSYLIVLLFIFRNSNEQTFFQEKEKYKNKELDAETRNLIALKLKVIIENELFLKPNFSLDEAAKELKVTKHILSQYVNEILGKSFSNLINEYKIDKAKRLLETQKNYTIESLGYDSGFNSKSTFFTAFKKITGLTPSEYQKMHFK